MDWLDWHIYGRLLKHLTQDVYKKITVTQFNTTRKKCTINSKVNIHLHTKSFPFLLVTKSMVYSNQFKKIGSITVVTAAASSPF
jgi:hypothetical protein